MRRVGRFLIDAVLGERRQLLVRGLFLLEVLLEQFGRFVVAHDLRPRDERPVRRHLVVLGALAGRDQAGVHRRVVELLLHDRLALLDDAGNAVAVLALDLFVEAGKHALEALDLTARLLEMSLERRAQLGRGCRLRELRQRLYQLFLRVVGVTQFIHESIVQCSGLSHGSSPHVQQNGSVLVVWSE